MSANWLQEKSWPQVAKYLESDNRILLPVGSTEQHGIFSPLGTDSIRAEVLIEVLSDLIKDLAKTLAGTGDCVGGTPTRSSAEKGKAYHDHLVARLIEVLDWLKRN